MRKRISFYLIGALLSADALAKDVSFSASVDRTEITRDDSLSLKLVVEAEGSADVGRITFDAPGFQIVNQHQETYVQSFFENGRFGMKQTQRQTKVLRPTQTGTLRISNIQALVDGRLKKAADIVIQVKPGGRGTPPPRGYGGGSGLRGNSQRESSNPFFVRAEVDKNSVYKGEQVIVSYYIYQSVSVFNIQVDKYPVLNGFLREDLEMPILANRLQSEQVVLNGKLYKRALLMRYAAYPLHTGELKIDSASLKAYYQPRDSGGSEDDPFSQFFRNLRPQVATSTSDPVKITVSPLPAQDRPEDFSGGVGDFRVSGVVDRYELDVNQPLTLTIKVEGRGNVSSVDEPQVDWPEDLEVYETKSRAKTGPGGIGQKIFEILLIPRRPGLFNLPEVSFSFFDPGKKKYVERSIEPFEIRVTEKEGSLAATPGQGEQPVGGGTSHTYPKTGRASGIYGIKPPGEDSDQEFAWWLLMRWLAGAGFGVLAFLVGADRIILAKKRKSGAKARVSEKLTKLEKVDVSRMSAQALGESYEILSSAVYDMIDRAFGVGARSLSHQEIQQRILSVSPEREDEIRPLLGRAFALLDYAETFRFASSAGAISTDEAQTEFKRWIREAKSMEMALNSFRS